MLLICINHKQNAAPWVAICHWLRLRRRVAVYHVTVAGVQQVALRFVREVLPWAELLAYSAIAESICKYCHFNEHL